MAYIYNFKEEILSLYQDGDEKGNEMNRSQIARYIFHKYPELIKAQTEDGFRRTVSKAIDTWIADREIVTENVRYKKEKQKAQDQNRISNKAYREYARVENAVSEYGKALTEQNKKFGEQLSNVNLNKIKRTGKGVGVIQITDTHGNELIDLHHNKYDFNILAKRLKKYIGECINYFDYRGARKVLIAFTGDLLNSDRRLDELLNASTNRSKASILMIHLLKQAILEVRDAGYEIDIVSVLGNESRVNKEMSFSKEAFSDNYDFTIIAQLKQMFEFSKIKGVNFHQHDDLEAVVNIEDQKWLLKHNLDKALDQQKNTQSTIGKHALKGYSVDFCIGGHVHAHRGTDISCRSSSMSGSNSYNEHSLDLMGRASGVCYYVIGKERYYQYVDLQYADNEGYHIIKELEAYNAKSLRKIKPHATILEIII